MHEPSDGTFRPHLLFKPGDVRKLVEELSEVDSVIQLIFAICDDYEHLSWQGGGIEDLIRDTLYARSVRRKP